MLKKAQIIIKTFNRLYPDPKPFLKHKSPFELLVAVILSAQCTDERVNKVTPALFKAANTPKKILKLGKAKLIKYIHSCGFYNQKARTILEASKSILEDSNGLPSKKEFVRQSQKAPRSRRFCDLYEKALSPASRGDAHIAHSHYLISSPPGRLLKDFTKIHGVGRKTASVVMAQAFKIPTFPVDTHVFRVAHRLGLSKAKTPDKTDEDLRAAFPKKFWIPLHMQFISHGRTLCAARAPKCQICPLLKICPDGKNRTKKPAAPYS